MHGPALDQMLTHDLLQHGRIAATVPGSFRVDHSDRPVLAHAQAVGLGTVYATSTREPKLVQPPLQELPGRQRLSPIAALGLSLVAAQEDVTGEPRDTERIQFRSERTRTILVVLILAQNLLQSDRRRRIRTTDP